MADYLFDVYLFANFPINDYSNEVYYSSEEKRDKEFDKFINRNFLNISSINRSKKYIKLPMDYYTGNYFNYGYFIDKRNNKRYYFFVDTVEWNSNETSCTLHFSYDYWQTYCHHLVFDYSLVEREHVADDSFGKHIIDEGLPIDEYKAWGSLILNGPVNSSDISTDYGLVYCCTVADTNDILFKSDESALPSVCRTSKRELSTVILYSYNLGDITRFLNYMVKHNKQDSIGGLYAAPYACLREMETHKAYYKDGDDSNLHYIGDNDNEPKMLKYNIPLPYFFGANHFVKTEKENDLTKYQPRNAKCLTFPYQFVNITNNNGSNLVGQFELADDSKTIKFHYYFPVIEGNSSYGYLADYDGVTKNFDKTIQGQTNPELPYITNTFSAYLSANQNSIANQYDTIERNLDYANTKTNVDTAFGLAGSLLSLNPMGVAQSIAGGIMGYKGNELQATNQRKAIDSSLKDQASRGNIAHGSFIGSAPFTNGEYGFKAQTYQVTNENIKMIDDYFTMFGYKINQIKIPQFNSRKYWNYIKTSGCNVIANIPQDALNVIKKMFDDGVTIWHDIDYMYKYKKYKDGNSLWYKKGRK
ncbi:MAG: hypothetical protein IKI95_08840 [Clostridia bacterium]|nr:hypothetical protein [Clostridia bacterium]